MRTYIFSFAKLLSSGAPLLAGCALFSPAHADPAIVDYLCEPSLSKGDHITIDWNAGRNVILVLLPDKKSERLSYVASEEGFRYQKGRIQVSGKGDKEISLQTGKDPLRICTRQPSPDDKPGMQPNSPDLPPGH
jgi:membrane-bound inhibitor of C-type lysozyme